MDCLQYMKKIAGGTGNPAVLAEFLDVPAPDQTKLGKHSDSTEHDQDRPVVKDSKDKAKKIKKSAVEVKTSVASKSSQLDVDMDTSEAEVLELAKAIREPVPIRQPGKKRKRREKTSLEVARKQNCCRVCQGSGHNQQTCPMARQFGTPVTNELWQTDKWKAMLPQSNRNQPPRSSGLRSGVVAVLLREVITPVSSDADQQWVYVETHNPREERMKEAIVQAKKLAVWSKYGAHKTRRCYLKGDDRHALPGEDKPSSSFRTQEDLSAASNKGEERASEKETEEKEQEDEEDGSDLEDMQVMLSIESQRLVADHTALAQAL